MGAKSWPDLGGLGGTWGDFATSGAARDAFPAGIDVGERVVIGVDVRRVGEEERRAAQRIALQEAPERRIVVACAEVVQPARHVRSLACEALGSGHRPTGVAHAPIRREELLRRRAAGGTQRLRDTREAVARQVGERPADIDTGPQPRRRVVLGERCAGDFFERTHIVGGGRVVDLLGHAVALAVVGEGVGGHRARRRVLPGDEVPLVVVGQLRAGRGAEQIVPLVGARHVISPTAPSSSAFCSSGVMPPCDACSASEPE